MQQNDDIAYNYGTCATLSTGAYVTFRCGWCHLFICYIHKLYSAPVVHMYSLSCLLFSWVSLLHLCHTAINYNPAPHHCWMIPPEWQLSLDPTQHRAIVPIHILHHPSLSYASSFWFCFSLYHWNLHLDITFSWAYPCPRPQQLVPISCFNWWWPPQRAHWTVAGLVPTSLHISCWSHCWCIFLGHDGL